VQVQVRTPWFRYLLASIPAGGYVTLENTGDAPAVLLGADSPGCGSLMLHRSETAGGTDSMVRVARVTIPAHGQFRFAPGGYHLMCMQPRMRVGQDVPVTLRFADGGRITVRFAVRGAGGAPAPDRMKAGGMKAGGTAAKMHM
jgi:copper(I)-binding protein